MMRKYREKLVAMVVKKESVPSVTMKVEKQDHDG